MVRACGFAEGEDTLFGVNRFPDSVGVKGGNVIHLSKLKVVPLWMPVSEQVGKGTGGPSLLQSPAIRAAWLCCNTLCGIPAVFSWYVGVEDGPCTCMFVSAPDLDRSTTTERGSLLGKAAFGPVGVAGLSASCCSHNRWPVLNCLGYLVPWGGFVIAYVLLT